MNIIICAVYLRAAFISFDVVFVGRCLFEGGVYFTQCGFYSRATFISLNVALWGGVYLRASFIRGRRLIE